jgi:hypothetical protein
MTANFGGTPNEIERPPIASATHVVLNADQHVPIRLVIRENFAGQWLVCVETQSVDGKIIRPIQIVGERSTIYSTLQKIVTGFHLPSWLIDRCLLSLRDSAKDTGVTQQASAK